MLRRSRNVVTGTLIITAILSAILLLLYAYLGTHIRMIADDYCNALLGREYGAIEGTAYIYRTWSSRYTSFFIEFGLAPFQPSVYPIMPSIALIAWLGSLYYLVSQVCRYVLTLVLPKGYIFVFVLFLVSILYRVVPSEQHIFWSAGIIPYMLPMTVMLIWIGAILQYFSANRSRRTFYVTVLLTAILVLILGGTVETHITFMVAVSACMLLSTVFVPREQRRDYLGISAVIFLCSVVTLAIALLSPGVAVRQSVDFASNAVNVSVVDSVWNGIVYTLLFWFGEFIGIPFGQSFALAYLSALFIFIILGGLWLQSQGFQLPIFKHSGKIVLVTLLLGLILTIALMTTGYYSAAVIPMRPLILGRVFQICAVSVWAYLVLSYLQQEKISNTLEGQRLMPMVTTALCIVIIWTMSFSVFKYVSLIPDFQAYSEAWDARHDLLLQSSDDEDAIVEPLAFSMAIHLRLTPISPVETFYPVEEEFFLARIIEVRTMIGNCAAEYYGVRQIID